MELHDGLIKHQGVVVIDNVTSLPTHGEPYVSPHLVIGLAQKGWTKLEYDMKPVEFHAHEISVLYPNHILMAGESSDDYSATLLVVSSLFFEQQRYRCTHRNYLEYLKDPAFMLNEEQYETTTKLIDTMRTVSQMDVPERANMLVNLLETLSQLLDVYRFAITEQGKEGKDEDLLFTRFYDALVAHYSESREVHFYAELLHLSPKYFATLIKRNTGTSASDWIANHVIIQAKSLLNSRKDLNILQVSNKLGFPDQAAFSRFFKTHTNQTPMEYRKDTQTTETQ